MGNKILAAVFVVVAGLLSTTVPARGSIQSDYLTVRPDNGPGGTEVWIRGYVTPGGSFCTQVPVSFTDSSGKSTLLAQLDHGGPIDLVANIPTGAALGAGRIQATTYRYDPAIHRCRIRGRVSTGFTVTNAVGIFGFIPRKGGVGSSVTITGIAFTGATAVAFNGTPSSFTVDSDSQITATVPSGATTGPIEVDKPAGVSIQKAISGPDFVVCSLICG